MGRVLQFGCRLLVPAPTDAEMLKVSWVNVFCGLVIVVGFLHAASLRAWPAFGGFDASLYAAIAGLWEHGFVPYRDAYDVKPPGVFIALRASFWLWGHDAEGFRRLLLVCTGLGALGLQYGLQRAKHNVAGAVAGLAFTTLVLTHCWGYLLANTETLVAACVAIAFGLAGCGHWAWALLSGVAYASACLSKQPAAVFALPLVVQLALTPERWRRLGAFAAGTVLPVALVVLYFTVHGALDSLLDATVWYSRARAVGGSGWGYPFDPAWWRITGIRSLKEIVRDYGPFLPAVLALPLATAIAPGRLAALAWLWLLASWVSVTLGGNGDGHYLVMAYPGLALISGIVCELVLGRRLGLVVGVLVLAKTLWPVYSAQIHVPPEVRKAVDYDVRQLTGAAQMIHDAARPGDTVFTDGELFPIYLYAEGVRPATRYLHTLVSGKAVAERNQAIASRPTFIVTTRLLEEELAGIAPARPWAEPLIAMLRQDYERLGKSEHLGVYRVRDGVVH